MTTQEQLDSIRKLHELDDRTLSGYTNGQYNIDSGGSYMKEDGLSKAFGDPYELANAILVGGLLIPIVTVDTINILGQADVDVGAIETYTAVVTFNNAVGGEDDTVAWSIIKDGGTGTATINPITGVADFSSADVLDGYTITATSNFDGTTKDIELVIVVATTPPIITNVSITDLDTPNVSQFLPVNGGVNFIASITFDNSTGSEDESITWSLENIVGTGTFVIDSSGKVTSSDASQFDGFDVKAVANYDGTSQDTLNVTVSA